MGTDLLSAGTILAAFLAGGVALFAPCCIVFLAPSYLAAAVKNRRWRLLPLTFVFAAGLAAGRAAAGVIDDLVAAAREEGPIVWYQTNPLDMMQPLVRAFESRYPGVKLQVIRLVGGAEMGGRIVQEIQAGAPTADVGSGGRDSVMELAKRGWLGQADWGRAVFAAALETGLPGVLDADALNLLAAAPCRLPALTVLTPHPGEAARLLGTDVATVQRDRYAAVRELARAQQAICVLKGAGSLVADPSGRVAVCPWGNPGMASGGMGDVLTGVIAALLAQGLDAWDAACLGVALHARAGDHAAADVPRGLLASDLFLPLRALVNPPAAGAAR